MDIVHEIIERAKRRIAEAYGLPDEVADLLGLVESEVKHDFGGEQVRIRQARPDRDAKAAAVTQEYLRTDLPAEEIASRHGISRATMYRYLKRKT